MLLCNQAKAQEGMLSNIITSIAEELAAEESDPEAVEMYVERLSELSENPVNINSADEEEISRLFFLTDFQIKSLTDYSRSSGKIFSVYELPNITGFNRETAEMIIPFIILDEVIPTEKSDYVFRSNLISNITYSTTAEDSSWKGSPVKILSKYKFTSGTFSGGLTMEKDQGEQLLQGKPPLPDFFSGYLEYSGKGFVRKLIVGDYTARFGEGLGINTGWKSGLFLTSPGYMSSKNEIGKYSSADENNFLRGTAATLATGNLTISVFYSQNRIDGVPADTVNNVKGIYTAGLHNTASLYQRKDILTNVSAGINLTYNFKRFSTGILWTEDRFSLPFIIDSGDPESIYDFQGSKNSLFSGYYNSLIKRILLYGEISVNSKLRHAVVQGASLRLSDRLMVNILLRNYQNGFSSFHGNVPGNGSWNEKSIIGNFTFEAARHLFVSAGCELKYYPWLKYRSSAPSHAIRQEIRLKYLPEENLSMEVLYNYRLSMNDRAEQGIAVQEKLVASSIRGTFRYIPVTNLILTTRIEYKDVNRSGDIGMLLSQDAGYIFKEIPLSFWYRYCIFRTGSWDSRLYLYENDLLYSFSIPALYGDGTRNYFMIKYELKDFAEVRFKYGITSSKSGTDKEDFRLQIRIFF